MNPGLLLGTVLVATFGLSNLLFAAVVALAWRMGVKRLLVTSADLLILRLLPAAGALLVALTVVLPAFLKHEPPQQREAAAPLLVLSAALTLIGVAQGIWRGWRACAATRALLKHSAQLRLLDGDHEIVLVDEAGPLTAVMGVWRPRIVTSKAARSVYDREEFRLVIAHEAAHIRAGDNLKLLMLITAPDVLAWVPLGATLTEHWRAAAEREADFRATGDDPIKRVALASALIKAARLVNDCGRSRTAVSMSAAADDIPGRVRALLRPTLQHRQAMLVPALAFCSLLAPVLALPLSARVHALIEWLVRLNL